MAHNERAKTAGVHHAAAENLAVAQNEVAIAEGHSPCIQEKAQFRHLAPLTALGQGSHWEDTHGACILRAAAHEFQCFRRINRGGGVSTRDDGGHASCGGSRACAAETFLMTFTRLADFDANIDQTGGKAGFGAVNDALCVSGRVTRSARRNHTIFDEKPAQILGACLWVYEARIFE